MYMYVQRISEFTTREGYFICECCDWLLGLMLM